VHMWYTTKYFNKIYFVVVVFFKYNVISER